MTAREKIFMVLIVAGNTFIYHFILVKMGSATAWLDTMIVAIGIIVTYYEIKRYADKYYLWLITDVIEVIQWMILGDLIMIVKTSIYLIMAVVGLANLIRLQREYNAENI